MYSNELKQRVKKHLLNKTQTSTNPWIYRNSYVVSNNLTSLIDNIKEVTSFVVSDRLDERIYVILHDIEQIPKCECGKFVSFKRFGLGYQDFCSVKCRANSNKWQQQVKKTNQDKYGVAYIAQLPEERQKRKTQMNHNRESGDYTHSAKNRKNTIVRLYGTSYNSGWTDEAIQTRIDNGNMVPVELIDEYREYYKKVTQLTKKQNLQILENFDKRGVMGKDIDPYHVDHIFSIYDGFMNDVPIEIVGHICNLQCIPAVDNIRKGNDSWITLEELLSRVKKYGT